jgi:hypothetical protein
MEHVSKGPAHQAYVLLRIVFIVAPIVAGLDKFFSILVDWNQYLVPWFGGYGVGLMMLAGIVEIIAGIGVIFKPKFFATIIGIWLALIIVNLLLLQNFYDVALRDLGLCLSAFALARLAKIYT